MAGDLILQWNCVSLNTHRHEVDLIISRYSPSVLCLQETRLKPNKPMTFRGYTEYYKSTENGLGGVGILVKNNLVQSAVTLRSSLQAVAVCVTIRGKAYIISSIYIPPLSNPPKLYYDNIVKQFDKPYLLCGDFNAHSTLWACHETNDHGKILEEFLEDQSLVPLNTTEHTRYRASNRPSLIDLSLAHPSIYLDFSCRVLADKHNSDHSPILITVDIDGEPDADRTPKWNLKRANWDGFKDKCREDINQDLFTNTEDKMKSFSSALLDIASEFIPKTSPFTKNKPKPWFDDECRQAKRERNKAERLAKRYPNMSNQMKSKLMQAKARKLFRQKKRDSWRSFVSSIDSRTRPTKVWNMIRRISGKNSKSHLHHLKDTNGELLTSKDEIADKLGQTFELNSSSDQYSNDFKNLKIQERV